MVETYHFPLYTGMITIPAGTLAGTQIVQAGGTNTSTTNSGQGTVTVTLPVGGNMVNAGGMVMVRPSDEVPNKLERLLLLTVRAVGVHAVMKLALVMEVVFSNFEKYKEMHTSEFSLICNSIACP